MIGLARNSPENLSPKLWFCLTKAMVSRKILLRISIESYGFLISPLRVALNEAAGRIERGYGSHAMRLRLACNEVTGRFDVCNDFLYLKNRFKGCKGVITLCSRAFEAYTPGCKGVVRVW